MQLTLELYRGANSEVKGVPTGNGQDELQDLHRRAVQAWTYHPIMVAALRRRAGMRRAEKIRPFSESAERRLLEAILAAALGAGLEA